MFRVLIPTVIPFIALFNTGKILSLPFPAMICFLFLVIQWLVSQVLESRQTRGDVIRRYATWQFDQHFGRDHQQQQQQQPEVGGLKPASRMANVYLPKRKFRQKVTYIFFCYFM